MQKNNEHLLNILRLNDYKPSKHAKSLILEMLCSSWLGIVVAIDVTGGATDAPAFNMFSVEGLSWSNKFWMTCKSNGSADIWLDDPGAGSVWGTIEEIKSMRNIIWHFQLDLATAPQACLFSILRN